MINRSWSTRTCQTLLSMILITSLATWYHSTTGYITGHYTGYTGHTGCSEKLYTLGFWGFLGFPRGYDKDIWHFPTAISLQIMKLSLIWILSSKNKWQCIKFKIHSFSYNFDPIYLMKISCMMVKVIHDSKEKVPNIFVQI